MWYALQTLILINMTNIELDSGVVIVIELDAYIYFLVN